MTPRNNIITNWPNSLTIARLLLIPLFIFLFYLPLWWSHFAATMLFIFASFTDWLDGYLARYLKQTTPLGAFLDPVADKLIVSIALVLIVGEPHFRVFTIDSETLIMPSAILTIPAIIIVGREMIVSALREWMAELGKRKTMVVSNIAKIKTTVQMLALIVFVYCHHSLSTTLLLVGYLLLYIAVFLTIWSMLLYLKIAWKQLQSN